MDSRQPSKQKVRISRWILAGIDLFIFAFAVASIEMTIIWNSIKSVYTVDTMGQLIALIIGIGGVLKILWSGILEPLRLWTVRILLSFILPGKASAVSNAPRSFRMTRLFYSSTSLPHIVLDCTLKLMLL